MKTEIMIAVLGIICIGSLAAAFVLWAKLDEQKKLTQQEHDRRWDEISRALSIEKELEQSKARKKCTVEAVQWYAYQLEDCERKRREERKKRRALQNKLSAILCPRNDHVWADGCCVKCGRVKE